MKKSSWILVMLILIAMLYLLFKINTVNDSGWIEETEELRELQRKLEINGYLTEGDLQQIRRIQDEQFDKKFGKIKEESNRN